MCDASPTHRTNQSLNDRIKNIVSVFYGIQCSLNNFELSAIIMTNSSPDQHFRLQNGQTRTQVCHAVPVVFSVDVYGSEHVCRVHPINVQLVTDPVIMDVILVQKVLTNKSHVTSCIVMLKDVIKASQLQKG